MGRKAEVLISMEQKYQNRVKNGEEVIFEEITVENIPKAFF